MVIKCARLALVDLSKHLRCDCFWQFKHFMSCIGIQFITLFYTHRLLWIVASAMLWPYQSCSCRTVDNSSCCCALSERI